MEPEFLAGDIVTVDPGREAINGSHVIAKNGEEATFKQLVIDGNNVYLKPLNTRYPIKDITGIEIKIVVVVVGTGNNIKHLNGDTRENYCIVVGGFVSYLFWVYKAWVRHYIGSHSNVEYRCSY